MPLDALDPATLLGAWTFSRVIDDHQAGDEKLVEGTAEFARADAGRIRWAESGTLHVGGQELPVMRTSYIEPRGDGWFVTFEDGRDFHPWAPGEAVDHHCGADLYSGQITATGPVGSFTVRWRVTGPKKDYTMTTVLTRG
ncbi:DUF6314 family protein [Tomitella biformata]|uniref:DUF6314 family protein n=1 Tax=Tomitella biformata TaxID=630403 RepID=UPI00046317BE|nr:DUF6314 family protein [Tomitella biformata]